MDKRLKEAQNLLNMDDELMNPISRLEFAIQELIDYLVEVEEEGYRCNTCGSNDVRSLAKEK